MPFHKLQHELPAPRPPRRDRLHFRSPGDGVCPSRTGAGARRRQRSRAAQFEAARLWSCGPVQGEVLNRLKSGRVEGTDRKDPGSKGTPRLMGLAWHMPCRPPKPPQLIGIYDRHGVSGVYLEFVWITTQLLAAVLGGCTASSTHRRWKSVKLSTSFDKIRYCSPDTPCLSYICRSVGVVLGVNAGYIWQSPGVSG